MAAYDLSKDEEYILSKDGEELSHIKVYLHWFAGSDLDASAFLLGRDGVVVNHDAFVYYKSTLRTALPQDDSKDEDYYFAHLFNAKATPFDIETFGTRKKWRENTRPMSADGAVLGSFDDLGEGDEEESDEADETLNINLDKVDPQVREIVICITIHPVPNLPNFSFKDVRNPYVEVINDDTDEVLCRYELKEDFATETAAEVGKFINTDGEWKFKATGKGYDGGLQTFVDIYTD